MTVLPEAPVTANTFGSDDVPALTTTLACVTLFPFVVTSPEIVVVPVGVASSVIAPDKLPLPTSSKAPSFFVLP